MRFLTLSGSAISIYVTYRGYFVSKIVRILRCSRESQRRFTTVDMCARACVHVYVKSTIICECWLTLRKNERKNGRGERRKTKEYSNNLKIDSSGMERSSPPISGETSDHFPWSCFPAGRGAQRLFKIISGPTVRASYAQLHARPRMKPIVSG